MFKRMALLGILIPILVVASDLTGGFTQTDLNNITVENIESYTDITFKLTNKVSYTDFRLDDKVVVDLLEVVTDFDGKSWTINRGGIKTISVSKIPSAGLTRVIIHCDKEFQYNIYTPNERTLSLRLTTEAESFPTWNASTEEVAKEGTPEEKLSTQAPPLEQGLLSMRLEKADLVTVLRSLAKYSRMNMIIGDDVKGTVSVELKDVHWETAIDLILKTKGYTYIIEEGIIRVGSAEAFSKEREKVEMAQPIIRKVFELAFTTPEELSKSVKSLLSKRGIVEKDERTNSLIVTDIPTKVQAVQELVNVLDKKTPQVAILARVVDVDKNAARELGLSWEVTNLRKAEWNIEGDVSYVTPPEPTSGLYLNLGTIKNFAKISARLAAMESKQLLKTIANPRITTVNNKEANIFGGKKFAITTTDIHGQPITKWFQAGIELTVTPHINSLEDITMDITVELSDVVPGELEQITQTKATTQSLVKNGQTLVIGGFVHKTESKTKTGIPLLKDIPLIGNLFGKTTTEVREREVLIFITPHIIRDDMEGKI
ncbi:AMIN domain-containing protein [candidate division WOR-3 bacterium]|nr:AMIN domain-containing protein [candidate division WOR-3 bacterium]